MSDQKEDWVVRIENLLSNKELHDKTQYWHFTCLGCGNYGGHSGLHEQKMFCPECLSLLREVIKRQREIREI